MNIINQLEKAQTIQEAEGILKPLKLAELKEIAANQGFNPRGNKQSVIQSIIRIFGINQLEWKNTVNALQFKER